MTNSELFDILFGLGVTIAMTTPELIAKAYEFVSMNGGKCELPLKRGEKDEPVLTVSAYYVTEKHIRIDVVRR